MKINKNIIIFVLLALLIVGGSMYIKNIGLFKTTIDSMGNSTTQIDTGTGNGSDIFSDKTDGGDGAKWSENYKKLFVDACVKEGQGDDSEAGTGDDSIDFVKYCNCVADRLELKYTIPEFLDMMDKDPDLNFMFDEVSGCL